MLGNANMCQIVRRHVKCANMCEEPRNSKMSSMFQLRAREYQGNKKEKHVKLQGNKHIIGLKIHQFTFSRRGMVGTPTLSANR